MTYLGPYGRQYVAILAGIDGWAGAVVSGNPDRVVRNARLRRRHAESAPAHGGRRVYVFAQPEQQPTQ